MHLDKLLVLRRYFGHTAFRPGQEQLIDAVLSGQDVMGIMPTGGGKSLCYQVPALLLPGVTLVISPLISLMKDQVSALKNAGIPAAFINSSLSLRQLGLVYERARQGAYKVIYVAPERLEAGGFSAFAKEAAVSLVAVDEAHCISQWGQDFRPSYLKIATFIASLPRRPVVAAFTATATAEVRQDIVRLLQLQKPVCTVTGFDRPNLFFDVLRPKNKVTTLLALLRERNDKTGIVYCATRAAVEKVCQTLCDNGFSATRYHAGLADEERRANQEDFQFDRKQIMVATNAFGMGIDKSNVGFVIHYQMPKSLESYYQEAGRAGRDGAAADCILLFSPGDIETAKFFIANSSAEEQSEEAQQAFQAREYARLRVMVDYCRRTDCLRGAILDYFGQPHEASCGSCGNCKSSYRSEDITVEAQMILSCVLRVKEKLGYFVGKTLIARILTGSQDKKILSQHLDELSTYGLMRASSKVKVREMMDFLESQGYLRVNSAHSTLETTGQAPAVLRGAQQVFMPVRVESRQEPKKQAPGKRPAAAAPEAEGLYAALKAVRYQIAQEEKVPAYIIFSNATLLDMAAREPRTMAEFLEVSGVGEVKAARYGKTFLAAIAAFFDD